MKDFLRVLALAALAGCGGIQFDAPRPASNGVAFSPDGSRLAVAARIYESAGEDSWSEGVLFLLSADASATLDRASHGEGMWDVAWSHNGDVIVTADEDARARVFRGSPPSYLRELRGGSAGIRSIDIAPDGITTAGGSGDHRIYIWDNRTGALRQTIRGHEEMVRSVSFSPDGTRLATAGWSDGVARVWDVQSGAALRIIRPGAREVNSVSWSPDGAELAIGTDAAMVIVEAETGSIRLNNEARTGGALSVAWSPDGGRMAYGGADASVRIVDAASGALLREFSGLDGPVTDIAWSPDGGRLAAAAGRYARSWSVGP